MIKYIKKDKYNNELIVHVDTNISVVGDWLECTIYKPTSINLLLFKYNALIEVYDDSRRLNQVTKWDCKDIENWVDKTIQKYNLTINKDKELNDFKQLIDKGCH